MALRDRLPAEVADPARRAWLDVQLVALGTQAAVLAGDELPYLDLVTRCFDHAPVRRPDSVFAEAAARIDSLVPGDAPLSDRLADWDRRFEIPLDRLPSVVDWLVDRFRAPGGGDVRAGRWARGYASAW